MFIHTLYHYLIVVIDKKCQSIGLNVELSSCLSAKDYLDLDPSGRRGIAITTIKQGMEPATFTGWFQAWDPKMWETDPLERIRARF